MEDNIRNTAMETAVENSTAANSAYEIVVDDGSVSVPIKNKLGQIIGEFSFAPTDTGIADRYDEVVGKIDHIIQPLEHANIHPDGTTDSDDTQAVDAMKEATKRLYECCDYLFGGNMSEAFFKKVKPFSLVKGRFYFENVLIVVGKFISDQTDRELRQINRRLERYTQGYTGKPNRAQRRKNKRRR